MESSSVRILLVDDEAECNLLVRWLLGSAQTTFSIEWADSYAGAMHTISTQEFDVILVDFRLDERTGIELIQEAISIGITTPMIMLTGFNDAKTDMAAMNAGAADYIYKGNLETRLLERTILYTLERKRMTDALRQSEERFRAVISNAPVTIFATDLAGTLTLAEGRGIEDLALAQRRVIGRSVRVFSRYVPRIMENFRRAVGGETFTVVADFGTVVLECHCSPTRDTAGRITGVVCVATDITERRRSEEALRKSEQYFRLLIENVQDIIAVLEPDGKVRYESPAVEKVLGYNLSDLSGYSAFGLIHPDDRSKVLRLFGQIMVKPGTTRHSIFRYRHRDGSWRFLESIGTNLLHDPTLRGIIVTLRDVTERHRAEEERAAAILALDESRENYRVVAETARDAVVTIDERGRIIFVNNAVRRIFGYAPEDLVDRDISEVIPGYITEVHLHSTFGPAHNQSWNAVELQAIHSDGRIVPIEMSIAEYRRQGERIYTGIARDISERKRLEEEREQLLHLVEHERGRLDSLIASIPGIVWESSFDPRQAQTEFVSPYVETMFGYTPEEWLAQPEGWVQKIHPDDRSRIEAHSRDLTPTGTQESSFRYIARDGRIVWVDVRMVIVRDENGTAIGTRGIVIDITDRKNAEEALRQSEERFRIILENSPIVVSTQDLDLRYTWIANGTFYNVAGTLGKRDEDLFDPAIAAELIRIKRSVIESGSGIRTELEITARGSDPSYYDLAVEPYRDADGEVIGITCVAVDITERKETARELTIFRALLDQSNDAIFVSDPITSRFLDVNQTACLELGYTREELLQMRIPDIVAFRDEVDWTNHYLDVKSIGGLVVDSVHCRKNGECFPVEASIKVVGQGQTDYMVAVVRDVSERRRAQEDLRLFRNLLDRSNDAIYVIDPETARILDLNEAACTDLGYPREELLSMRATDIDTSVSDIAEWLEHVANVRRNGSLIVLGNYRRKDGSELPIEVSVQTVNIDQHEYLVAVARNMTERMHAEQALRTSQEFFQSFMDNIPALAFMKDLEGRYVYGNRLFHELTERTAADLNGRTDVEIWPHKAAMQFRENDAMVLSLGRPLSFTERLGQEDKELQFFVVKFPMYDTEGRLMLAGIAVDVSERIQAQRNLEESQQLNTAILHSLAAHIAVLNKAGTIVTVNQAWERYGMENGAPMTASIGIGTNYLDVCREGVAWGAEGSAQALAGIQRILSESIDEFTMEYPLHTPDRKQWFLLSVTALRGLGGAVVSHIDITERKSAEIALRQSQSRFLTFLNNSPVIFFMKEQNGQYVLANELYADLVGRSVPELIGSTDFDVWPAGVAQRFRSTDRSVIETEAPVETEERMEIDGVLRSWFSIRFPVPDESGRLMIGAAAIEITERIEAEQSLRKSEERFQMATRATNDAIWDWNIGTGTLWWNQNFQTLFRYRPEDLIYNFSFWHARIHPEDRERVLERLNSRITEKEQFWNDDYRFRRGDGSYAYVFDRGYMVYDGEGRPIRMIGAMVDITERKNAEEALRESEEKYRQIAETAQEGIVVTNAAGIITFANVRLAEILGYTADEIIGRPYADLMDDEWRRMARAKANRRRLGIAEQYDFKFARKDGTSIWAIVAANPVFDAHGAIVGSLGMITDITDRKRTEEALREAHDKLELRVQERTAKIVAMMAQLEQTHKVQKRFVADASHDLRTPLTVVRAEIDLLLHQESHMMETRRSLIRMAAEVKRLESLASDLLLLATLDAKTELGPRRLIRLDELLLDSIANLAPLAQGKEIAWNINIDEPIEIICDPAAMDRAITNILENAIKYSPDSSVIAVTLGLRGEYAEILVADTGIGIPREDLQKVFDRFYRSDLTRTTPGTGLGLSIVKAVVESHQGHVHIESEPNIGTSVHIMLPDAGV